MRYAVINKDALNKWIEHLKIKAKLYAPRKKENTYVFRPVKDPNDIALEYISTILPPKKYYFPQKEKLMEYRKSPFETDKAFKEFDEFILFAVHTCDIAGIQCMDVIFREAPEDSYYLSRKDKMTIIGIECLKRCDSFSNCTSMGNHVPRGGYDLMMTDIGNKYILHINSEKGRSHLKDVNYIKDASDDDMKKLEFLRESKKKIFKEEFSAPISKVYDAFDKSFDSPVWEGVGKKCIGCGNCTSVCPTCYCFDILDEMNMDMNSGLRFRIWNSCQMDEFAKVAGGEDFRKGTLARQRHRFFRKFKYSADKFNRFFCTGCGRCSRTCMAKINLIDTVNAILK